MKVAIIIPAYNESANIAAVVDDVNSVKVDGVEIEPVVINDKSEDNTGEIIDNLNCVAIHLPVNLGIGGAVQTGWKYALENNFDFAIQLDGDGQHPAEYIKQLVEEASEGFDVVIASRYIKKLGYQSTFVRRLGIKYFKFLNKLLLGIRVTDNTSGYRCFNRKALGILVDYYPDDYPEPEAVVLMHNLGMTITEIPIEMKERAGGVSSIGTRNSIYYMVKVTLAILFTYLRTKRGSL